jgi:hypothetical protein
VNAVEIEEAISQLADRPFDPQSFPFALLEAFGNKATTIKRLKSGSSNSSDVEGGVLQRNNIHMVVCETGAINSTLKGLRESSATTKGKAKFVLATDGVNFEAEDLATGETVACEYSDFPNHFGFFLPLAGITTVQQIRNNPIDIQATGRLNRLYIELLKTNEDWATSERRHEMNQFMAQLIFCFFAEDTDIFRGDNLFTSTIEQMSDSRSDNTDIVIRELFRAMDTKIEDREAAKILRWADVFPYVNGGLFAGEKDTPKFSRIARSYLLHAGNLNWQEINPDIFGSMIQAVADDDERGELGMHYTSVPNILKVLNPLFLDSLREKLEEAGNNSRKLLNLRKRISNIRVFDPACGSGNFLVIAYKEMRFIEHEINKRRNETFQKSEIPLTNFRGIELRDFPAEIARLALIIAEYQCDVLYRGQKDALAEFLPLDTKNWITSGNALRLDWLSICPPTGQNVKLAAEDLFHAPLDQSEIDFENEGGETYVCGNPPYIGDKKQTKEQKDDLGRIFAHRTKTWKSLDYVCGWFVKAADYGLKTVAQSAFVATNSVCQGQQVPTLWPIIFSLGYEIVFAHTSFKWSNLASHNAGVTVVIIGIANKPPSDRKLFSQDESDKTVVKFTDNINAYLVPGKNSIVKPSKKPISEISEMLLGNFPKDGGHLILNGSDLNQLDNVAMSFVRPMFGGHEFIQGRSRFCFWVTSAEVNQARKSPELASRFDKVRANRLESKKKATVAWAEHPYRFVEVRSPSYETVIAVPRVSSEGRPYIPVGPLPSKSIVTEAFALYDAQFWNLALIASRLHLVWITTVCGKLETRIRYSNTMGWNTFPIPALTEKNKTDLTRTAEDILLAREAHFPATIADLYDPKNMPENLLRAHDQNDEALERIYIGRKFKNDTERLEKLFELYAKMTTGSDAINNKSRKAS